jgi:hypothetical protein
MPVSLTFFFCAAAATQSTFNEMPPAFAGGH